VRAITTTAVAYAVLAEEGDTSVSVANRILPALRYVAAIHVTGTQTGTDGKKWGRSWQSAMWAGNLGVAAWLVRDKIDPETLAAVKRVVADEADQFNGEAPPTMEPGDTKAEENAWDLTAPAAAVLLMPDNPHAPQWQQSVERYGFNTLSVAADRSSNVPADGKTVREWVSTEQLYPDYTLENHGFFHPVYMMVAPATNAQAAVMYKLGDKPVPDALTFNDLKQWEMLKYVTLPDGEWLYTQGLDWDLHDYEHIHYWTALATLFHDPAASVIEARVVTLLRKRQQLNGDGSFVGPTSGLGFARESIEAERVSFALLMHKYFGNPPSANADAYDKMAASLAPDKIFPYVGMVVHRDRDGLISMAWKNRLMAQVVPDSAMHLDEPYVTTPSPETLVGGFTIVGQPGDDGEKFHIDSKSVATTPNGFRAVIDATTNAGALRRRIAIEAIRPGIVAYSDIVTALKPVTISQERGLLITVENDAVSGGSRKLTWDNGSDTAQGGVARDINVHGNWINVDDRLAVIVPGGSGIVYRVAGQPNRAGAREDSLIGAYNGVKRTFNAGATVAARSAVVLLNRSSSQTSAVATNVDSDAAAHTLTFVTPDGAHHAISMPNDGAPLFDNKALPDDPQPYSP
jgi:hypothetical protein